jgi:outer membrane lipoprotein SlyB
MPSLKKLSLIAIAALPLMACAPNLSPEQYSASDTQQANQVLKGVIISTSQVEVSGSKSDAANWVGPIAGAVAGGLAGSMIGQGTASDLAAVGGAVAGGVIGDKAQQKLTSQTATQYIIQLAGGNTISVTQGGTVLPTGTKVLVIEGKPTRVIPDTTTHSGS